MAKDESSRRGHDRDDRPEEHDYGHAGTESGYERRWTRGEGFRPSWPEQRGSFGEREYGQRDQGEYGPYGVRGTRYGQNPYGREPGYRERIYAWPHESMGMGTNMPYYGGSQYGASPYGGAYPQPWGGAVGFGAYVPSMPPYMQHYVGIDLAEAEDFEEIGRRRYAGQPSHAGKGPKGYKRADDRIHEEICEKLTRDPWIDATHVEVKVKDGEAKLEGHVHDRRVKHRVEDIVAAVSGVREIHNGLKVEHHDPGFKGEMKGERGMEPWENGSEFEESGERLSRREKSGKG